MLIFVKAPIIFLLALCISAHGWVSYRDISEAGANCPPKNSCAHIKKDGSTYSERTCECDRKCGWYDDCCFDAPLQDKSKRLEVECLQYGDENYNGVYAFHTCPQSAPPDLRRQCTSGNWTDPMLMAPVTDTANRKTYKNYYCALCNEARMDSLTFWTIRFQCPDTVRGEHNQNEITFDRRLGKYGIVTDRQFTPCSFLYDKPDYLKREVRLCRANALATCNGEQFLRQKCKEYTSVVMVGKRYYKNPHCAKCAGASSTDMVCLNTIFGRKKPFSFALLLDVNRSDGDIVGVSNPCSDGEKYDPFFKKCRKLVCAIPGYTMVNGRCQKQ